MDSLKERCLVTGDVNGNINYLYSRVNKVIQKCGQFDFLICIGEFFSPSCPEWESYRNGTKQSPIETYILGPNKKENMKYYATKDGSELAPNIHYLGRFGVLNTSKGVKIAYISGLDLSCHFNETEYCTYGKQDIIKLRDLCRRGNDSYSGIDLLITSQWPKDITELDKNSKFKPNHGSSLLSWLVSEIMPRYHICGHEGRAYERPPFYFKNGLNERIMVTRFVALGPVEKESKDKSIYAVNLLPLKALNKDFWKEIHENETPVPFGLNNIMLEENDYKQYFFDRQGRKRKSDHPNSSKSSKHRTSIQSGCWFCLSDTAFDKHLVISIGKYSYLALPKGGIVNDHFIISSIAHRKCMAAIDEQTRSEICDFKKALKKFFSHQGKEVVFFERNFKTFHLQIHVVPIPRELAANVTPVVMEHAEKDGLNFDDSIAGSDFYSNLTHDQQYFSIQLPCGKELIHLIKNEFPIQFGRNVLVSESLLNKIDKSDWRTCTKSKEQDEALTCNTRKKFRPFDFTLDK